MYCLFEIWTFTKTLVGQIMTLKSKYKWGILSERVKPAIIKVESWTFNLYRFTAQVSARFYHPVAHTSSPMGRKPLQSLRVSIFAHSIMTRLKKAVPDSCDFKVLCFIPVSLLGVSSRFCPTHKPLFSERKEGWVESTWVVLLCLSVIRNVCHGHRSHVLGRSDTCVCSHTG